MRIVSLFLLGLSARAVEPCEAGVAQVYEVETMLAEARAAHDIIRVQALTEKLLSLREHAENVCWQMEHIVDEAQRAASAAPDHLEPAEIRMLRAPSAVGFGLGVGLITLHGEILIQLAVPVGVLIRGEFAEAGFEFAGLVGALITGGDLKGNDKVGLFGLAEARFIRGGRWLCPLAGVHANAPSVNFADRSFFLVEGGVHIGLMLPLWDALRIAARYGIGRQESDLSAGWWNQVSTLTLEARVF